MTSCLGKSFLFTLHCVSFLNVYQPVCVFLSILVLRVLCGFDCYNSEWLLSIYFSWYVALSSGPFPKLFKIQH